MQKSLRDALTCLMIPCCACVTTSIHAQSTDPPTPFLNNESSGTTANVASIAPVATARVATVAAQRVSTPGLLPREETGARRFMERFPDYDGRGVVVAIFDTGVDPGAAGLQLTPDGRPKVIDMIDGTGSGDVDTTTVVTATDGFIEGLSGRPLRINPEWKNPSGEFHVGIKRAFHFYPTELVDRLKSERRKSFDLEHARIEEALRRQIDDDTLNPAADNTTANRQQQDRKELLNQLNEARDRFDDAGPLYDCVVFHDGQTWWAIVDTDEDADLTDEQRLTDFRVNRRYATFGDGSILNFGVNIYDDGDLLSIVADCGAHGTHVAGIVSAWFPEHPELTGVAPGAQIVSVKIGHSRLGGMETGAGMIRGINAVLRNKCDLVNMSFGEPTAIANGGRVPELFSEAVNKHGVIWVASAGNSGPALSTVGAPGGTTSAMLGIGAYLSPAMMNAEYTLRSEQPDMPYTWTSRGPTFDGDLGIDLFAPGGAIAPVPTWTLQSKMRMNGTSMASPNACGTIALLLSGLKQQHIAYSPASVRRALQSTARVVDQVSPFTQGPGLVQVNPAWDALLRDAERPAELSRFEVTIPARNNARGIYLREAWESRQPHNITVHVAPHGPDENDKPEQIAFELPIRLESSAPWVHCGQSALMTHGGISFEARINPLALREDSVEYAEIRGFDTAHADRSPLFTVPITIVRPAAGNADSLTAIKDQITFEPQHLESRIHRHFVNVPVGSTWANIRLRRTDDAEPVRYVLHTLQRWNGETFEKTEVQAYVTLSARQEHERSIPVIGGRTLEVCVAQYWSSLEASQLELDVDFHGIAPNQQHVTLNSAERAARIDVVTTLTDEDIKPSGTLRMRRNWLHPVNVSIRPLDSDRDRLFDGRIVYEARLEYAFDQTKDDVASTTHRGKLTLRFPLNDDLLYDSPLGNQLWMLFDDNNQLIGTDDVWPEAIDTALGEHKLIVQLRHTDPAILKKYEDAVVALDRDLDRPIRVTFHGNRADALLAGKSIGSQSLQRGQSTGFYVAGPPLDSVSKQAKSADILLGTLSYSADALKTHGSQHHPDEYTLAYSWIQAAKGGVAKSKPADSESKDASTDRVRRALDKLKTLDGGKDASAFEKYSQRLLKQHPDNLDLRVAMLHRIDDETRRKQQLEGVVAAADEVILRINADELALHFGRRVDTDDPAAVKVNAQHVQRRNVLVDALYRKGRALAYMELPDVVKDKPIADQSAHDKAFEANFRELAQWVDTTDDQSVLLHIRRDRRNGFYGATLKRLESQISAASPNLWHFKKRRDMYEELDWNHLFENERKWFLLRFPKQAERF